MHVLPVRVIVSNSKAQKGAIQSEVTTMSACHCGAPGKAWLFS
jgi:hypothetical protein